MLCSQISGPLDLVLTATRSMVSCCVQAVGRSKVCSSACCIRHSTNGAFLRTLHLVISDPGPGRLHVIEHLLKHLVCCQLQRVTQLMRIVRWAMGPAHVNKNTWPTLRSLRPQSFGL